MELKLKKFLSIVILFLFVNCNSNDGGRSFSFSYEVDIDPSDSQKTELWLPYPQSNEVQKIKNILVDSGELEYEIKDELVHGNKYLYFYKNGGLKEKTSIQLSFDVTRNEHQNVEYENVNPDNYLSSYSTVQSYHSQKKYLTVSNLFHYAFEKVKSWWLSKKTTKVWL